MSDTDGKKTLGLRGGSRPGNVKQSFSHGRTKNVVVETKRKRVVVPKPGAANKATGAATSPPPPRSLAALPQPWSPAPAARVLCTDSPSPSGRVILDPGGGQPSPGHPLWCIFLYLLR